MIGESLREAGHDVDVRPARDVSRLTGFEAVVLGSALYSAHWRRDANRFAKRHLAALQQIPVWLFSSGPLDRSADFDNIPVTEHVEPEVAPIGARGHRTFGGRLLAGTPAWTRRSLPPTTSATSATGSRSARGPVRSARPWLEAATARADGPRRARGRHADAGARAGARGSRASRSRGAPDRRRFVSWVVHASAACSSAAWVRSRRSGARDPGCGSRPGPRTAGRDRRRWHSSWTTTVSSTGGGARTSRQASMTRPCRDALPHRLLVSRTATAVGVTPSAAS